ncbi:asparagine synthetase B family protein [Croceicoccus ponticola]|uniref:asparagine synthase (glutamine-hydrolyzing) n=1 Tax=Croceicoccus ponticola TaxID=2217664 RepID=A0A437GXF1_9SPHN|nr:asparagine synthetase B family protein [Croceicoccus ponticola]RVQ67064.1 asparagine synthetase B family protein [Croceicoccus ponticola]
MIAAGIDWGNDPLIDLSRIVSGVPSVLGGASFVANLGNGVLIDTGKDRTFQSDTCGHPPFSSADRVLRAPSGAPVLFNGWLDNHATMARELDLPSDVPAATIYGAAVEAWGIEAERRLIGDYAAVMIPADGVLRMARAPWSSRGLFWAASGAAMVAASTLKPIFAAGFVKRANPDRYAEMLYGLADTWGDRHFYDGIHAVPQGSVVTVDHGRASSVQWYDPHALAPVRFSHDREYVDAATGLLAEAVESALRSSRKPGILLSGGLDSPIVAAEMLRQLPTGRRLKSFTFEPLAGEHEPALSGHFHSDRPAVERFAAMHPALDPQFVDNGGIAFGNRLDDMFRASDAAYPGLVATEFHGPWQAAADAGCDWLFTADFGNQTFSCDGRWAFVEFLRTGQFGELMRLLRDTPGDDRPMLRRLATRSILPNLPAAMRAALRTLVHGSPHRPLVRREVVERLDLETRYRKRYGDREWVRSRADFIDDAWQSLSGGTEMLAAVEQMHGFRMRAVPQYRPLIEFSLSIPTDQFVRGGTSRWLARRMAQGRMPEQQRLNTRYGRHGVDWHQRNTPRIAEMRMELERLADDPLMSAIIDVDRAVDLLDEWPDRPTYRGKLEVFMPTAAAIVAGRFARYVEGRN